LKSMYKSNCCPYDSYSASRALFPVILNIATWNVLLQNKGLIACYIIVVQLSNLGAELLWAPLLAEQTIIKNDKSAGFLTLFNKLFINRFQVGECKLIILCIKELSAENPVLGKYNPPIKLFPILVHNVTNQMTFPTSL
jgi:hypothetical protein